MKSTGDQSKTKALRKTHAKSARVSSKYTKLDVKETRAEFERLKSGLERGAEQLTSTIEGITPYLVELQALTSQRGAKRKEVLKQAGVPTWTELATDYGQRFGKAFRTVQDRILKHKRGTTKKAGKQSSKSETVKLNPRQQTALVKAQLAANDLVRELEDGHDYQVALTAYRKVAVSPATLDSFVNAVEPEPDYKELLGRLLGLLGRHEGKLPSDVAAECASIRKLLVAYGTPGREAEEIKENTAAEQPGSLPKPETNLQQPPFDVDDEEHKKSSEHQTQPPSVVATKLGIDPSGRVTVTKCPPALEAEGERADRSLPSAEGYYPDSITRAGYARNQDGGWEYVGQEADSEP
jgi:hypothetical protein